MLDVVIIAVSLVVLVLVVVPVLRFNVVVKVVIVDRVALNLLCNVVVDDFFELACLSVFLVVAGIFDVVVPFFSAEVVVKDVVVDNFLCELLEEQFDVYDVGFDALQPTISLDVEYDVGDEL